MENPLPPALARYHRQIILPSIGVAGQRRLLASRVLLIGCGALGTALANTLVRAGVGHLTLVDRDFIEPNNLQRQSLFDEDDIAANLPKAIAAQRKLARINSAVRIDALVTDVNHSNIQRLAGIMEGGHVTAGATGLRSSQTRAEAEGPVDLLLDGTDNLETRFLINDLAIYSGIPWIYGAVLAATGMAMVINPMSVQGPGSSIQSSVRPTPCLRCIFETIPPPGSMPTCDVAGVLSPAVALVAAWQAAEAIKLLTGQPTSPYLFSFDLLENRFQQLHVASARKNADCPVCKHHRFDFLSGKVGSAVVSLCGRDAVQLSPRAPDAAPLDLAQIAATLRFLAPVTVNPYLLKCTLPDPSGDHRAPSASEGVEDGAIKNQKSKIKNPLELTLFPDGRAIIKGTTDPALAKTLYAKYIGA